MQATVHINTSFYIKQQIYPHRWFRFNWCTQCSTCQALLEVLLDLGQSEFQVHSFCLFSSTGFLQLGYTLIQEGLCPVCCTETPKPTQYAFSYSHFVGEIMNFFSSSHNKIKYHKVLENITHCYHSHYQKELQLDPPQSATTVETKTAYMFN